MSEIQGAERVGHIAAELMEAIEAAEIGDDLVVHIGTVAVVVELTVDEPGSDEPGWTEVKYRCSDSRRWVQQGFFVAAQRAVLADPTSDEDDE